ncbi:hypothetical protein [Limnoraphis robusta]|uniref:Uncharacterized protein n=1 Tax=Limnoraphis robusta CS-951 TaxID=1637645 RepID=A0A0F5YAW4_9CYAN|nr:hypothetical protein [Limnoraphis robusta]KKD35883.1 hypothetical protein WN50_22960 [Limnoraphis robusta CS-951]MEA5499719.1 hypothetical protein [Limnoraphis robusta BA-68 BA1]
MVSTSSETVSSLNGQTPHPSKQEPEKGEFSRIEITDNRISICNLEISDKEAVDYLQRLPQEEWEKACIKAFQIGILCLERTQTTQDTEFVKRQIDTLITQVEQAVKTIPEAVEKQLDSKVAEVEKTVGEIPETVQKELIGKMGTENGQVLAPVKQQVREVSEAIHRQLKDVQDLLSREIDPSRNTSTLGKALEQLKNLLDPARKDSVQGSFTSALQQVTTKDGILAEVVKKVVKEAVDPLTKEMKDLALEVRGEEGREEARQQTTLKGFTYEEEVLEKLQQWASVAGAEVHYVGVDNQAGDFLVKITLDSHAATEISIVIEARDRGSAGFGRKRISDQLTKAMSYRQANAAIYLSRNETGLGKEIGDWAVGVCEHGNWIATTHEHMVTAIRFLIARKQLEALRASKPDIDAKTVEAQIEQIRTTLKRITKIKTYLKHLRDNSNSIEGELEDLKRDIRNALDSIDDEIRKASSVS